MNKLFVRALKKSEALSAVACRLTQLTGKSQYPIHPKHLVPRKNWYVQVLKKNDIVLDLGCGVGSNAIEISKKVKKIVGVDIDQKNTSIAWNLAYDKKIKNAEFMTLDANKQLPFKSNTFNSVICSDVLEHLNRRNFALKEIKRVLKKKGLLILVTDNPDTSWKKIQKAKGLFYYADPDHKYEYSRTEIEKVLIRNQMKVLSISSVTYDTPWKGWIDLVGGVSLSLYLKLQKWKANMVQSFPEETTGFRIIAQK